MNEIPTYIRDIILAMVAVPAFWTFLTNVFQWIGTTFFDKEKKATLDDVMKKVDTLSVVTEENAKSIKDLKKHLESVENKAEEHTALTARRRILEFNDEVINNDSEEPRHTKEHWMEIMRDIDDYEEYTENHPDFKNNYATESITNLKSVFQILMKEHKF